MPSIWSESTWRIGWARGPQGDYEPPEPPEENPNRMEWDDGAPMLWSDATEREWAA